MKKIYLYLVAALLSTLVAGLTGCGDNTDFSSTHLLTQAEIDELARQDSILKAQKEQINADLILEYAVSFTVSATGYDGATLAIETDKIAELFGISAADMLKGIEGESGAPEVKGFAIEGTTHADNMTATTTNGKWGHWWKADGDVTSWGSDAAIFAEFDTEDGSFTIGQYPGRLVGGQVVKVIECLKYNDLRVAVVITVTAKGMEEIKATIVNTQELNVTMTPRSNYDQDAIPFNLEQTLKDLGISSVDEASFIGVNADGSYAQEPTTGTGFWYDANGFVGSWGDDARVYTTYGEFEADEIGVGQMPGTLSVGDVITVKYGFLANDKIEMFKITVTVAEYEDPETPPTGDPENAEYSITLTKSYSDDYASVTKDIKDMLRGAFKMTTYQIYQAILSDELKVYLNKVSEDEPSYTADAPGYWITSEGEVGQWASSVVWCSIGYSETELYLFGGNHPGNCPSEGQTVTTKFIVSCKGVTVTFHVEFIVTQ